MRRSLIFFILALFLFMPFLCLFLIKLVALTCSLSVQVQRLILWVRRQCSVSLQHALSAWGPIQWYKAHNTSPWACSHTHAWNKAGHIFSAENKTVQQHNLFLRVTSCFPCARNAGCFDPGNPGFKILLLFHSSHLIWDCFTSGEGKRWKQNKAGGSKLKITIYVVCSLWSVIHKCKGKTKTQQLCNIQVIIPFFNLSVYWS